MQTIKEVLIKEVSGVDKVYILENLPKQLLFVTVPKKVLVPTHATDYSRFEPKEVMDYVVRDEEMPDEPRNRKLTGAMEDKLHEGIEYCENDGGYVFHMDMNEAVKRLKAIDDYVRSTLPPLAQIPQRIPYAAQPGSFTSHPKPLSQIPRVVLPVQEPISPPVKAASDSSPVTAQPSISAVQAVEPKKRVWTDEQKKAAGERLKAAREAKKLAAQG